MTRRAHRRTLTGFQIGLVRSASVGRLWLDARVLASMLVTADGLVDVTPDVAVLRRERLVYHDRVDVDLPPAARPPYVLYHPLPRGEDLLMATARVARRNRGTK